MQIPMQYYYSANEGERVTHTWDTLGQGNRPSKATPNLGWIQLISYGLLTLLRKGAVRARYPPLTSPAFLHCLSSRFRSTNSHKNSLHWFVVSVHGRRNNKPTHNSELKENWTPAHRLEKGQFPRSQRDFRARWARWRAARTPHVSPMWDVGGLCSPVASSSKTEVLIRYSNRGVKRPPEIERILRSRHPLLHKYTQDDDEIGWLHG